MPDFCAYVAHFMGDFCGKVTHFIGMARLIGLFF